MTLRTSFHLTTELTDHLKLISSIMLGLTLVACASKSTHQKPHGFYQQGIPERYQVRHGDTVSKIAARYDLNWREVSRINRLDANHTIRVGQWLTLTSNNKHQSSQRINSRTQRPIVVTRETQSNHQPPVMVAPPKLPTPNSITTTKTATSTNPIHQVNLNILTFGYPIQRQHNIARHFGTHVHTNGQPIHSEGTWFLGNDNEPVQATQAGVVMQTTQTATGDIIDILHEGGFVSSYFHVKEVMVRQGQRIEKGEMIAKMRQQQSGVALLELRIAKDGNYINPMTVLK